MGVYRKIDRARLAIEDRQLRRALKLEQDDMRLRKGAAARLDEITVRLADQFAASGVPYTSFAAVTAAINEAALAECRAAILDGHDISLRKILRDAGDEVHRRYLQNNA